jgi:hypothetical protein
LGLDASPPNAMLAPDASTPNLMLGLDSTASTLSFGGDAWGEDGHFKFWWGCPRCQPSPHPHMRTPSTGADMPLRYVRPDRHMARGWLAFALGVTQLEPSRGDT